MRKGHTSGVIRQLSHVFQGGTLAGLSDREILGRFVDERDEAAFEVLLSRHGAMVRNVCRQIVRDPDDADDAFQATFLALACKAGALRIGESLGPWLYRVASRVAARARADRRRRGDRERSGGPIPEPVPDRGDPSDRDEIPRVVHEELVRLPERLRAPIVLCYLEGMTHEQAARQLGCPVGTVRSRMARARSLLHQRMVRRGMATTVATLGAMLTPDVGASALPPRMFLSLAKTAADLAAGTDALRGGCGIPARVAALLEGVLRVLRIKRIAGSLAAFAVIGVLATAAGLAVFPASGQTGDDGRSRKVGADGKPVGPPPAETIVKTYYVGDLIIPPRRVDENGVVHPSVVDMTALIQLIATTIAPGTWQINDGNGADITPSYGLGSDRGGAKGRPPGAITPFFLTISLIVRHTPEAHDEVARLLRGLREFLAARDRTDQRAVSRRDRAAANATPPTDDRKPTSAAPDRQARIRRLLEELRKEVDELPKDPG